MKVENMDASLMQRCFLAGAKALEANKEWINELNVFPVPDGDTGTNMTMTIMAAAREVQGQEEPTIENLSKAISSGSLRGARGNSGVILSQIFRGFTKEVKKCDIITIKELGNGIIRAADTAYKAVMKPKEGTILTVIKSGADKSRELLEAGETSDLVEFSQIVVDHMDEVLKQTPEMLPVLKQAGVVDSGGQGLMTFAHGVLEALKGNEVDISLGDINAIATPAAGKVSTGDSSADDIKFGYCTEFIIMMPQENDKVEPELKAYLNSLGDCVVVVADDDIVKVHVHTNDPGLAIQKALTYGQLTSMKIDNMREEHQEKVIRDAEKVAERQKEEAQEAASMPRKEAGFIAVSVGDGLKAIFEDLGVDYVIEGGQTMNPSTEDILEAIEKVNADAVYILPNNGNIILAAQQAQSLTEDKEVVVIPSKNIPQGIAAMINYIAGQSTKENQERMTSEMEVVKSGQVTYAVRDTQMDGKDIKQGDFMGLTDKTILAVGQDLDATTTELIEQMMDEDSELISLYYGADVTEDDAQALADHIMEKHEDVEVEVQYGGQPIYSYFLSIE